MWTILESKVVHKQIPALPTEIVRKYEFWKNIVRTNGVAGLRAVNGFHDEKLKGKRDGQRSSRLNQQYRVIYDVEAECLKVRVLEITPHHY